MLTNAEKQVATVIYDCHELYQEWFSDVFFDDIQFETEYSAPYLKGVLSSLVKKGYVFYDDVNGEENVYYLTKAGFKELKGKVPEYVL